MHHGPTPVYVAIGAPSAQVQDEAPFQHNFHCAEGTVTNQLGEKAKHQPFEPIHETRPIQARRPLELSNHLFIVTETSGGGQQEESDAEELGAARHRRPCKDTSCLVKEWHVMQNVNASKAGEAHLDGGLAPDGSRPHRIHGGREHMADELIQAIIEAQYPDIFIQQVWNWFKQYPQDQPVRYRGDDMGKHAQCADSGRRGWGKHAADL